MPAMRVAVLVVLASLALAPAAHAQGSQCLGQTDAGAVEQKPGPPLRFGITPGVQTGQFFTGAAPPRTPEDRARHLAALGQLRPQGGPFVLRLHRFFWSEGEQEVQRFLALADAYTRAGYLVELQLRYHPSAEQEGDIDAWVAHVRDVVRRFGANPRVVAIQVTNEVNITFSPDSSDGAYDGARDALVRGVIAAKDEALRRGYRQLEIGFNWAYRTDPGSESTFWNHIRDAGGRAFAGALDWVGVDAYPGTVFPPAHTSGGERDGMVNAFSSFRCYAAGAGIPDTVPIHVEENGWPTAEPERSYAQQAQVAETLVRAVHDFRGTYNISDYRWFNLRDGNTQSGNFQTQYGLLTDEYQPKPAFDVYRRLVGELSTRYSKPRLKLRAGCRGARWRGELRGADTGQVLGAAFRVGDRHAKPDRRAPFVRSISPRGADRRRTSWTIVVTAVLVDGRTVKLSRPVARCGP
jgi:hypothetical protein